jgi:hypothetical protein
MTPEQLEAGYARARRRFGAWSSILRRSLGVPNALKRIAYNTAWMKVDPLWVAIIRSGLMPFASRIFERVLRLDTRAEGHILDSTSYPAPASAQDPVTSTLVREPLFPRHDSTLRI